MEYLLSMKRIKDYGGNLFDTEKQHYEYASYDIYASSRSTGYPVFDDYRPHAIEFKSVWEAIEWRNVNKRYISSLCRYDLSTLAVRKEIVHYSVERRIKEEENAFQI